MTIRVLLADDHAVMRDGLRALLAASPGIEVVGAVGDGREAVRLAVALKPHVVVMDVAMPELNGIEAVALLRERCPGARVVMLSMHADAEHVYRAFDAGAAGYLLKDSAGDEVVCAIRAVHLGKQYLSRALSGFERRPGARAAATSPLASLSARERQVLQLVVEGRSSAEIAAKLHLSPKSVDTYRSRLMKKLGVADFAALVKFAVQHGLTPPA
jgi:DNA-binding NarL/FixJ family response regulator